MIHFRRYFVALASLLTLYAGYAYAVVHDGVRNEVAVHVTTQKELAAGRPRWRKVIGVEDEVTAIAAWKSDLYALSHRNAPRSRILRLDASSVTLAMVGGEVSVFWVDPSAGRAAPALRNHRGNVIVRSAEHRLD